MALQQMESEPIAKNRSGNLIQGPNLFIQLWIGAGRWSDAERSKQGAKATITEPAIDTIWHQNHHEDKQSSLNK